MEGMVVHRNHFFECFLWFFSIGCGGQFVRVMHCVDHELFFHADGEDGVPIFEFFIPSVVRVRVRYVKLIAGTLTATKDDQLCLPVD